MFILTLRHSPTIPLELDGITPDRLDGLSAVELSKRLVQHGNRGEELGQFFDIVGSSSRGQMNFVGDTRNVKGIGAGMAGGLIKVEGHTGMHAGAGMTGGRLVIGGGAGDWVGAEMTGGTIDIRGSVGDQCGAAYRGSRRGMTGGTIVVRGSAGDELGLLMRRGLIAVGGDCGEFAGASLIAGSIFVSGRAGNRLGAGMKRGTIVAAGGVEELPPSFVQACDYRPSFLALYRAHLPAAFAAGLVRCYRGDLLTGGRGEVLIPVSSGGPGPTRQGSAAVTSAAPPSATPRGRPPGRPGRAPSRG